MTYCNKNPITIYQGFPTKWNDENLLTITFDSEILLDGFGAEFTIGEIVKTYTNIEEGFSINLSSQETGTLPLGAITGTLVIIDTENNKRPFSTELPFMVKDWADGDIKLDGFDISIKAKIQENRLTVRIESANPGSSTEEMIKRYIAEHNQSEEAHQYIQELIDSESQARESADEVLQGNIESEQERAETAEEVLDDKIDSEIDRAIAEENKKVDKVATENRVYGTDGSGNQTTYPVDGFGKVDDVQVGGVSVVQNKIASLGTMAGETASDYRKASAQDTIDSGLDDRIDTLESYTPSNASSSNKFAVESEITSLQNTKQDNISDLSTIRSNAQAGKSASDTISTYGNIVTHNVSEFATAEQGAKADTALQSGDNITELLNNADYQTGSQVNTAISNHNTSESAHSYIQGLISSEESRAEGVEGSLSSLTTDAKNNLVSAINEVDSHSDVNASDISDIKDLIPNDASSSNQLADKNFVNSSISTNTSNFIGTFNSVAELEAYSGTLTNNDYAFVVGTDSAGNTVYDRYKYTDATAPASWIFEYELNNSSFTADQWAAINSLATSSKIAQITTNQNAIGTLSSLTTTTKTDLVSAINELDSNKLAKNSAITGATKCKITYDGNGLVTEGVDLSAGDIPSLTLSKISDITATANELNVLDGITASTTELNYTDGVTSNIQTQLNGKVPNTRKINDKQLDTDINLTAADIGALPSSTFIPMDTNDLINGAGFITISALNGYATETWVGQQGYLTSTALVGYATEQWVQNQGYLTSISSSDVVNALGYIPYNSTNPSGYQANVIETVKVNGTALTPSSKAVDITIPTNNNQLTNGAGYITSSALTGYATEIWVGQQGYLTGITSSDVTTALGYTPQQQLVSGTNIKTVNSQSLLGSGNIEIQSTPDVDNTSISLNSSDKLQTIGVINQNNTTTALKQWSGTKAQYDAIVTKDSNTIYNITDDTNPNDYAYTDLSNVSASIDYVVESQLPTSSNNYTWYRLYKSGWVEQGGIGNFGTQVNLTKEMNSTKYSIQIIALQPIGGSGTQAVSITATSFMPQSQNYGGSYRTEQICWEVKGMSA